MFCSYTATAVAPGKVGGDCTADTANTKGTCEDANALCSATTGGTCGCKTGYTGTNGAGVVGWFVSHCHVHHLNDTEQQVASKSLLRTPEGHRATDGL